MYLSYISPPVIIHTEITSLTKKGRNNKQKHLMKCDVRMMIDHDACKMVWKQGRDVKLLSLLKSHKQEEYRDTSLRGNQVRNTVHLNALNSLYENYVSPC